MPDRPVLYRALSSASDLRQQSARRWGWPPSRQTRPTLECKSQSKNQSRLVGERRNLYPKCRVLFSSVRFAKRETQLQLFFASLAGSSFGTAYMSIADHFHHAPDAAFVRNYDGSAARRQFRMSIVLVGVIALAAAALGAVVRFDGPSAGTSASFAPVATPAYAGKL